MIKSENFIFGSKVDMQGNKERFRTEFQAIANSLIEKELFTKEELIDLVKNCDNTFDSVVDGNDPNEIKKSIKEAVNEILKDLEEKLGED